MNTITNTLSTRVAEARRTSLLQRSYSIQKQFDTILGGNAANEAKDNYEKRVHRPELARWRYTGRNCMKAAYEMAVEMLKVWTYDAPHTHRENMVLQKAQSIISSLENDQELDETDKQRHLTFCRLRFILAVCNKVGNVCKNLQHDTVIEFLKTSLLIDCHVITHMKPGNHAQPWQERLVNYYDRNTDTLLIRLLYMLKNNHKKILEDINLNDFFYFITVNHATLTEEDGYDIKNFLGVNAQEVKSLRMEMNDHAFQRIDDTLERLFPFIQYFKDIDKMALEILVEAILTYDSEVTPVATMIDAFRNFFPGKKIYAPQEDVNEQEDEDDDLEVRTLFYISYTTVFEVLYQCRGIMRSKVIPEEVNPLSIRQKLVRGDADFYTSLEEFVEYCTRQIQPRTERSNLKHKLDFSEKSMHDMVTCLKIFADMRCMQKFAGYIGRLVEVDIADPDLNAGLINDFKAMYPFAATVIVDEDRNKENLQRALFYMLYTATFDALKKCEERLCTHNTATRREVHYLPIYLQYLIQSGSSNLEDRVRHFAKYMQELEQGKPAFYFSHLDTQEWLFRIGECRDDYFTVVQTGVKSDELHIGKLTETHAKLRDLTRIRIGQLEQGAWKETDPSYADITQKKSKEQIEREKEERERMEAQRQREREIENRKLEEAKREAEEAKHRAEAAEKAKKEEEDSWTKVEGKKKPEKKKPGKGKHK